MTVQPHDAVVRMIDVSRTFSGPPPLVAVGRTDLEIARGDFVTLTGPSGCGKTTLLNLAGLLDQPTSGELEIDGRNATSMNDAERSRWRGESLGFVFQAHHMIPHKRVIENVALAGAYTGLSRTDRLTRGYRALDRVGLRRRAHSKVGQLSGGERQRVAIARAIAHGPALLLCDEPTGNLDSVNARNVIQLLLDLNSQGQTVLLVTHDDKLSLIGGRRLRMLDGHVFEDGLT